jgi:hypothetical protein
MKVDSKKAPKLAALIAKLDKAGVAYDLSGHNRHPSVSKDGYELANSLIMPGIGEMYNPNPKRIREALK